MDAVPLQILGKLIRFGIAMHKGLETEGITSEDMSALQSLVGVAASFRSRKSSDDKPMRAIHLGLVVRSFGVAMGRHWAFNEQMVPKRSR